MTAASQPVVVLGGGIAGLAAGAALAPDCGAELLVLERQPWLGGLAASFERGGVQYPVTYHHIMESDRLFRDALDQLDLPYRMGRVRVGVLQDGAFHPMEGARDLLTWRELPLGVRLRMAITGLRALAVRDPASLNGVTCRSWFSRTLGRQGYDLTFAPLLRSKFLDQGEEISAEWLVRRLKTRESRGQFGYPDGGMAAMVRAYGDRIEAAGAQIITGAQVRAVQLDQGRVVQVRYDLPGGEQRAVVPRAVLSTLPAPALDAVLCSPPAELSRRLGACRYMACVTGVFRFDRRLGQQYCTSLGSHGELAPAIFDQAALLPAGRRRGSVLYLAAYMPPDDPRWGRDDDWLLDRFLADAELVYPGCSAALSWSRLGRLKHAKPVYRAGYRDDRLWTRTSLENLFLAGTLLFPPLRNIGYSVHQATLAADAARRYLRGAR